MFFQSIFSIYFSSMEFIGLENIPPYGPVIFTCNHMNQAAPCNLTPLPSYPSIPFSSWTLR